MSRDNKDLERQAVEPGVAISSLGEHELAVHVRAPAYVRYFHLLVPDEHTRFSDNYFDLAAGEERTIVVTNELAPLAPEALHVRWL
jgi:beta-mannosidase